jgi:hypothetical protein
VGFEDAVIATTGYPLDRFDTVWRRSVKRRYGWLTWLAAGGMWLILGIIVIIAHWYRRRRDRPRRVALDQGWDVAEAWRLDTDEGPTTSGEIVLDGGQSGDSDEP